MFGASDLQRVNNAAQAVRRPDYFAVLADPVELMFCGRGLRKGTFKGRVSFV